MSEQPESETERRENGKRHRFAWPRWARWVAAGLIAAATALVVLFHHRELVQALRLITEVRLSRLAVGAVCEAVSIVCLAAVPCRLLRAGGTEWSLRRWTAIMLGANAMAGAVPGGAALATAWNPVSVRGCGRRRSPC